MSNVHIHTMKFALHEEPYRVTIPEGWEVVEIKSFGQSFEQGWKVCPLQPLELYVVNDIPQEKWIALQYGDTLNPDFDLVIKPKVEPEPKRNQVEYLLLNEEQKIEAGDEMMVKGMRQGYLEVHRWVAVSKEMIGYTLPEVGGGLIRRGYVPYPAQG